MTIEEKIMPTVSVNGLGLHTEFTGSKGEPVVLVHGSWGDSMGWDDLVPLLAGSYRVLGYDRRGHSQSEGTENQGSILDDVSDLEGLIDHYGLVPAHIIGNSFGGVIVLKFAAKHPDLVRKLIVHEPPAVALLDAPEHSHLLDNLKSKITIVLDLLEKGDMEQGAKLFMESIVFGPGSWDGLSEEARLKFINNAHTFLDEQKDTEWTVIDHDALSAFSRPVLITYGSQSPQFFGIIAKKLSEILPDARLVRLQGMGHVPQMTHPAEYSKVLIKFIEG